MHFMRDADDKNAHKAPVVVKPGSVNRQKEHGCSSLLELAPSIGNLSLSSRVLFLLNILTECSESLFIYFRGTDKQKSTN